MSKTITVKELRTFLGTLPDDMEVYASSDEEGNNYGAVSNEFGTEVCKEDNVVILYPHGNFEFDEIAPIEYNKEEE